MYTEKKVATFQKRFSDLIESSDKTITAIAKDLHVSNQTISAWKIGTRSPKAPTVIVIANYFGVCVEWIMGFDVDKKKGIHNDTEPPEEPQTDEVRLLIRGFNKLPKEQQEQALNVFRAMFIQTYPDLFDGGSNNDNP